MMKKRLYLQLKINSRVNITIFFVMVLLLYENVALGGGQTGGFNVPTAADLARIMQNLGENLHTIIKFLIATSYVMGVWFISSAVNELRIYGQARTMMPLQTSFTGPLARLLAGIVLLFLPGVIDISIYSLWNYGAAEASTLRFDTTGSTQWDAVMNGIRLLIQTFGYISIMRGFILLSRIGKQGAQPGMFGKGIMHVLGGILAVNIIATVRLIEATLGFVV